MTTEELEKLIIRIIKELEEQKQEAIDDADAVNPNDEKVLALEAKIGEYEDAMGELQKAKDVKIEAEEDDEPPKHKFTSTTHFYHDVYDAGENGRSESSELTDWRKYTEKAAGDPTQSAGVAESGGYLLPVEYADQAFVRQTERSAFMQNALNIPMTTKTLRIPTMMGYDESSNTYYGNVAWAWSNELKEITATDIELEQIELGLEKLTGMVYLSDEIMRWARPAIQPLVDQAFDVGLNRALTKAFLRGTGAGQPLGILNSDCTIEISAETNQPVDTFLLNNMLNMQAVLYSTDENPTGLWYANRTLIPSMAVMVLPGGTASTPMFMVAAQPNLQYSLMGLPLRFSTIMSSKGDVGDVVLMDPTQYFIGVPAGGAAIEQASSIHVQFVYSQTAFKFTTWIAGQPGWRTKFTPEFGDDMSPFITLAAR